MQFFQSFLFKERFNFFNFIPVFFGIGICIYFSLENEPKIQPYFISCISLTCLLFFKKIRLPIAALLFINIGFINAAYVANKINIDMLNEKINFVRLAGEIDYSEKSSDVTKIVIENVKCMSEEFKTKLDTIKLGKISLIWRGKKANDSKLEFRPGAKIYVNAILEPIYSKSFRNAYDFRMQSYFNGISARGYIVENPIVQDVDRNNITHKLKKRVRFTINERINNVIRNKEGGIVQALITGNKSVIDKHVRQSFADSGLSHLLAISGLHVGVIGGFFFILFRILLCCFPYIALNFNTKKIASVLSLFFVFLYLKISGESIPSVRAFIMQAIIVAAILFDRKALSMRTVAIAAMIVLSFSPEALLFPSFQMSFGAVAALIAFYEKSWTFSKKTMIIFSLVATSFIASVSTSIFTIHVFNRLTIASVFANLLAVPLTSLAIMPLLVLSILCIPFGCESIFLKILEPLITLLIKISDFFASQFWMLFTLPKFENWIFILISIGFLIVVLLSSKARFSGLAMIALGFIFYYNQKKPLFISALNGAVFAFIDKQTIYFDNFVNYRRAKRNLAQNYGISQKKKFKDISKKFCIYNKDGNICSCILDGVNFIINTSKYKSIEIYKSGDEVSYVAFSLKNRKWS